MYTINKLAVLSFVLASSTLALPVNPISPADLDRRVAIPNAEASNLEVSDVPSFYNIRDTEVSELQVRANDPYGGKFAPSEATRKQEIKNTANGLSPDGKTGDQLAKEAGKKPDGDNGRTAAAESVAGHELKNCGSGCIAHYDSIGSKQSQTNKAHKAGYN